MTSERLRRQDLVDTALEQLGQLHAEVEAAIENCGTRGCTDDEPCGTCETLMFATDTPLKLCWAALVKLGAKEPARFKGFAGTRPAFGVSRTVTT